MTYYVLELLTLFDISFINQWESGASSGGNEKIEINYREEACTYIYMYTAFCSSVRLIRISPSVQFSSTFYLITSFGASFLERKEDGLSNKCQFCLFSRSFHNGFNCTPDRYIRFILYQSRNSSISLTFVVSLHMAKKETDWVGKLNLNWKVTVAKAEMRVVLGMLMMRWCSRRDAKYETKVHNSSKVHGCWV